MIPLHRPAFGVGTVVAASLAPRTESKDLRCCEEAHAAASGCAEAVWLPSGRAGIAWALRAAISPGTQVLGPAFTCSVVHEAMVRSGGQPQIVDAAGDSFTMDLAALQPASPGDYALVLSEPYGHTYDLKHLAQTAAPTPRIRIVDSAMAVPQRALFERLRGNDFAVVSFGAGKNSYAGWGAMGFTRDPALANELRKIRDPLLAAGSFKLTLKRSIGIGLRTAAQNPLVFSVTRKLWYQANALRPRVRPPISSPGATTFSAGFPAAWSDDKTCGCEWRLPSTKVDRGLALRNLERAESVHAKRLTLARRYHDNLAGVNGIMRPPVSPFALSHYTVRVAAGIRNRVKEELLKLGVYTISLWAFNAHLNPQEFPNAFRLCSEVISLPLSPWMTMAQVDEVCERLLRSMSRW